MLIRLRQGISSRWWAARGAMTRAELRLKIAERAVWLLPLVAIWTVYFSPRHVVSAQSAITYLVAVGVFLVAARRPDRSLLILIVVFPFQTLLLAKLFALGVPASIVHHLGAWKETLALAVVFAGIRQLMAAGTRLDMLDKVALGFVAVCALYAGLQNHIVPGAPAPTSIRLLGFRETAGFVLLLFGARHAPLGSRFPARAARAIFLVGTAVSAIGIFEAISSSSWNHFVIDTMRYPQYSAGVLGSPLPNPGDIRIYGTLGGSQFVRIGSVFLDELALAWYLILPFAIGIERIVRGTASAFTALATVAIGAALLLTQTRSAIAGAAIVVFLTLPYAAGRGRHWRVRASLAVGAVAMLAIPGAFATGVAKRIETTTSSGNGSTQGHIGGFFGGLRSIEQHPLGLGLGTGAGTGQRFAVPADQIPEDNYLEVGDELGLGPGLLFVLLTLTLLVWLRRSARARPEPLATAAWTAGVGLAVAACFLQTWSSFQVAWTFWAIAGAMAITRPALAPVASRALSSSERSGYGWPATATARR